MEAQGKVSAPDTRATVDDNFYGMGPVAVREGDENSEVKIYIPTPKDNGGLADLKCSDDPFYWRSANETKHITMWHPYSNTCPTNWTVKADQSKVENYQANDLVIAESDLKFDQKDWYPIAFEHQTAKVEIRLKAADGFVLDENTSVKLLNIEGVEGGGTTITTYYKTDNRPKAYFALLNEQTIKKGEKFIQITTNGTDFYYKPKEDRKLGKCQRRVYEIMVNAKGLDVSVSESMSWGTDGVTGSGSVTLPTEIDLSQVTTDIVLGDGTYFLKGNGQEINHPIIVNGNADITFENEVKIKAETAMKINEGHQVKLNVKGKGHSLVSTSTIPVNDKIDGAGIQIGNNSSIEIVGDSKETSVLSVTGSPGCAGIGLPNKQVSHCTGITIWDIDLTVKSTSQVYQSQPKAGAAIGLGYVELGVWAKQELDKIEIINSHITATSESGACIGTGFLNNETTYIGEITISGSVLSLTANKVEDFSSACIGFGSNGGFKEGMQTSISSVNISDTDFDNCSGYQIIGNGMRSSPNMLTLGKFINGITIDGKTYKDWWNSDDDNGGIFGAN